MSNDLSNELPLYRMASDPALTGVAFQVMLAIHLAPRVDDAHVITQQAITKVTGRSKNAIRTALTRLEDWGYILVKPVFETGKFYPERHYVILGDT